MFPREAPLDGPATVTLEARSWAKPGSGLAEEGDREVGVEFRERNETVLLSDGSKGLAARGACAGAGGGGARPLPRTLPPPSFRPDMDDRRAGAQSVAGVWMAATAVLDSRGRATHCNSSSFLCSRKGRRPDRHGVSPRRCCTASRGGWLEFRIGNGERRGEAAMAVEVASAGLARELQRSLVG